MGAVRGPILGPVQAWGLALEQAAVQGRELAQAEGLVRELAVARAPGAVAGLALSHYKGICNTNNPD